MNLPQPDPATIHAWYDLRVRLGDEDHYAHVNNAVYYEYFDSAVNGWLAENLPGVRGLPALSLVVASSCRFVREVRFPDRLRVGIAVERLGRSSVTYRPAIFLLGAGEELTLCAYGEFVHVYVDPETRRPVPIPAEVRAVLEPSAADDAEELIAAARKIFT
ncbi:acyl-CoA thioesterase [Nocardia ignorata]|uniref:Acyl-CoA thioester hydrolase n=1 Tax=Nocardia ignorata TaxID=145285 RepID=A0A4R6P279_NOCIG|nr:thioesterase family protein [Nocardia ignorata]TDP31103.1 acyl-CoA thioester hydrolase [Nocardia ignorata]